METAVECHRIKNMEISLLEASIMIVVSNQTILTRISRISKCSIEPEDQLKSKKCMKLINFSKHLSN